MGPLTRLIPVVVEPRQEPRAVPVLVRRVSVPVRPQHIRSVREHELIELGQSFSHGEVVCGELVGGVQLEEGIEPLEEGVIDPQAQVAVVTDRARHLIHQIPFWSNIHRVPVPRGFGAPKSKTCKIHK